MEVSDLLPLLYDILQTIDNYKKEGKLSTSQLIEFLPKKYKTQAKFLTSTPAYFVVKYLTKRLEKYLKERTIGEILDDLLNSAHDIYVTLYDETG
jgi:hypothetical protein